MSGSVHVIYPPSVTWGGKQQRPQHLLRELARRGMIVHYIDGLPRRKVQPRLPAIENIEVAGEGQFIVYNSEEVFTANFSPDAGDFIVFYAQYPGADTFAGLCPWIDTYWYDYLDDFPHRRAGEMDIIRKADIVTASGKLLLEKAKSVRRDVTFLSNGCDYEHFRQAERVLPCPEIECLKRKLNIGYIGALAHWWDLPLMDYVASQFDFGRFFILGNTYDSKFRLPQMINNNVIHLGTKDYAELPAYLSHFDVCLIPFNTSLEVIQATNPIKMYEYFASGKPVVATAMPEVTPFEPLVKIGKDPRDFVRKIIDCYAQPDGLKEKRQEIAKQNDWTAKGEELYELIIENLKKKNGKAVAFLGWIQAKRNEKEKTVSLPSIKHRIGPVKVFFPSRKYAVRNLAQCWNTLEGFEVMQAGDIHNREHIDEIGAMMEGYMSEFRPDVVFWEGMCINGTDQEKLIDLMNGLKRKYDFRLVYWATEDPPHHKTVCMPRAKISDYVFATAKEFVPKYKKAGKPSELLLFGANPLTHKPLRPENKYTCDIVYVGNNYAHPLKMRGIERFFFPLIEQDYDFRIYGIWWDAKMPWLQQNNAYEIPYPTWRGSVAYREMARVYSSAKIVLGLQVDETSSTHTPFRPYEILASGGFHISQRNKAIENVFEGDGKYLVTAGDTDEFMDKVKYYLAHPEERRNIAEAGRRFVLENHTYIHRAEQVTKTLKAEGLI